MSNDNAFDEDGTPITGKEIDFEDLCTYFFEILSTYDGKSFAEVFNNECRHKVIYLGDGRFKFIGK